jgi:hypothetical protein
VAKESAEDFTARDEVGRQTDSLPSEREEYDRSRAYLARLDQALDEEEIDPVWAQAAEPQMRKLIAPLVLPTSSVQASCRRTLCRVEVAHADEEGHTRLIANAMAGLAWTGAAQISLGSEDGRSSVLFLSKPGRDLPDPAE